MNKPMFVDIPSDAILPEISPGIKEMMKNTMENESKKIIIDTIEWTAEGLRIYFTTEG
jgi:hypothetical protein